jgi:rhomboid protease GluP
LHGDIVHLVFNAIALFMAGMVLEGMIGRSWFVALFGIGALGGSCASLLINDPNVVSVGASGAIMALLASALLFASRLPPGRLRSQSQMNLLGVFIPALIPLATTRTSGAIDFAAHFGGALIGFAVGWLLLRALEAKHQTTSRVGRALAGTTVVAVLATTVLVVSNYDSRSLASELVPDDQLEELDEAQKNLPQLLQNYPRDPRVRYFAALQASQDADPKAAISHLEAALEETEILMRYFPDGELESTIRLILADLLDLDGRTAEAREIAAPACARGGDLAESAKEIGLCE